MGVTNQEFVANSTFDANKLERPMQEAGLDALVVTSRHNVQYLLGGYRFFFFDVMEAISVSRYLPVRGGNRYVRT
jgi:Xaa-Pro aminopeptidase